MRIHSVALAAVLLIGITGLCYAPDSDGGDNPHERPFLGVRVLPAAAGQNGLSVEHVVPNSTAAEMGIADGDVLTSLNGVALQSRAELKAVLGDIAIGDEIKVQLQRDGQAMALSGTMRSLPGPKDIRDQLTETAQANSAIKQMLDQNVSAQDRLAMAMLALSQTLEQLPGSLDTVAKEFKQVYPDGTFEVKVQIVIDTGSGEEGEVIDLSPGGPTSSAAEEDEDGNGEDTAGQPAGADEGAAAQEQP